MANCLHGKNKLLNWSSNFVGCRVFAVRNYGRLMTRVLDRIYNRYDTNSVKQHGSELACADWLLRCGSPCVRLAGPFAAHHRNHSPPEAPPTKHTGAAWLRSLQAETRLSVSDNEVLVDSRKRLWKIVDGIRERKPELLDSVWLTGVDASDSIISWRAAAHLQQLHALRTLLLHHCDFVDDKFFFSLSRGRSRLRGTLRVLEITAPDNMTDAGLRALCRLSALVSLRIHIVPTVRQPGVALARLRHALPHCTDLVLQQAPVIVDDFSKRRENSGDGKRASAGASGVIADNAHLCVPRK